MFGWQLLKFTTEKQQQIPNLTSLKIFRMENMVSNQETQKETVVMDDKKKYTQSVGKYTCCISSCRSKEPPFFAFPNDKSLKKLWEDATGKLNVRPNSHIK